VLLSYSIRHNRQLSSAKPEGRWLTSSDEGSVVLPLRVTEKESAGSKPTKQSKASAKEQQASALDHQVDDVISRFILKS
jgi:hypothetical protein